MGLSGTGRSREPGSGEVSDLGGDEGLELMASVPAAGLHRWGIAAGWEGVSGWFHRLCAKAADVFCGAGEGEGGELLPPPPPALLSCFQKQAEPGGGSKQSGRSCTSSLPGLSPSQTRCRGMQQVGRFSAGPVLRYLGPTWKLVFPKSVLGAGALRRLKSL